MKYVILLIIIASLALSIACQAQSVSASKAIQLTVYNGNFALIKDTRTVNLNAGVNSIEVADVAARIDPTSILFKSLTAPNSVSILEQNYQYDLISPSNILEKSVGHLVTFTTFDKNGSPYTVSGILMNPPSNGGIVIKSGSGEMILNPQGQVTLRDMPEGLHPKPTLNWLLQSTRAGEQQAQISYTTEGIGWVTDYVVLVNQDDTSLDLTGWVTLNNASGASYKDAGLTLMAGDVRRVQNSYDKVTLGRMESYADYSAAPQFQEKSFFEYHMYTMSRPVTIADKETKQLSLLGASNVKTEKELIYDGRKEWWQGWWYPGRTGDPGQGYDTSNYHKVNVLLQVKNSKENSMGMPLPKGRVRVYKLDTDGSQQFIGEDTIDHTPKDEKIRLYIGDAFDIVGDYKRTDFEKISDRSIEETFQVNLRNHKDTPVTVKAVDHVWSDWKVLKSSADYTKKDAHTIEFPVKVPANGESVVTYTIRTTW